MLQFTEHCNNIFWYSKTKNSNHGIGLMPKIHPYLRQILKTQQKAIHKVYISSHKSSKVDQDFAYIELTVFVDFLGMRSTTKYVSS